MIFRILLLFTLPVVFGAPGNDKGTSDADSNEKYIVDCTKRNFQASQDYCKSKGWTIASFQSDQDFNDAKEKVKKGRCNVYVGATSDGKGNWKWLDGSKWWTYSNNDGLEGTRETCLVWRAVDNKWNDWGTGDDLVGVICKNQGGNDGKGEDSKGGEGGNNDSKTDDSSDTNNNSKNDGTNETENSNQKDDSSKTDNNSQ